tara:strand:+ start:50 stop:703 length:654 start_codon:yes stop_codon:yes gene_type:complete
LLCIALTIYLGLWQLDRLKWKEEIIKNFNSLQEQKPLSLSMGKMKYPKIEEFTKIISKGTIDRSKKIFLPAKTNNGKNGIRIGSLWTDNHGNNYLVDEGWFPKNKYEYFKNNNTVINVEIIGYIRFPTQKKMFTPENSLKNNEWYYYDLQQVQNYFDVQINQKFFIKNMSNHSENFLIPSSINHNFTNNHLQYAITWFLMSISFSAIFFIYFFRENK